MKQKDSGREEIDRNEHETDHKYQGKDDLENKIADLMETIIGLITDTETLKGDIAAMKTEVVRASEDHEAEYADLQQPSRAS